MKSKLRFFSTEGLSQRIKDLTEQNKKIELNKKYFTQKTWRYSIKLEKSAI